MGIEQPKYQTREQWDARPRPAPGAKNKGEINVLIALPPAAHFALKQLATDRGLARKKYCAVRELYREAVAQYLDANQICLRK